MQTIRRNVEAQESRTAASERAPGHQQVVTTGDLTRVCAVRSIVVYRAGSNEPDAVATIDPLSQAATTDDRRSELGKVSEDGVVYYFGSVV